MRVSNSDIFKGAIDASVTQTSIPYTVYQVYGWSATLTFAGSPVGVMSIEVSNDPGSLSPYDENTPSNWTTMANSSQNVTGVGTVTYNVNLAFYNWIRFVYTATSGSGTIAGRLNTKGG